MYCRRRAKEHGTEKHPLAGSRLPYYLLTSSRSGKSRAGIVKLKLTAVFDVQHGGFTTGWNPVSWGALDELLVNLTMPAVHLGRDRREGPPSSPYLLPWAHPDRLVSRVLSRHHDLPRRRRPHLLVARDELEAGPRSISIMSLDRPLHRSTRPALPRPSNPLEVGHRPHPCPRAHHRRSSCP